MTIDNVLTSDNDRGMGDEFERRIRNAVRGSGRSLSAIAQLARISQAQLSRFMREERTLTLPVAEQVCDVLGLVLRSQRSRTTSAKRKRGRTMRDYSKYAFTETGKPTRRGINKRNIIFTLVKYLVESKGISPDDIEDACVPSVKDRRMLRLIDGSAFDETRWFQERIHSRGTVYALSNQWGPSTDSVIERLREKFPAEHRQISVTKCAD